MFKKNCCDGIYNSFDVHFTSLCDNKCAHCIDNKYSGIGIKKPNVKEIVSTIVSNKDGYDDVLFLGGEPCLFLNELYECIIGIKKQTDLKVYVTTSVPKVCMVKKELFLKILDVVDGINLSVQHHNESIADEIRKTKSKFDRQEFYKSLPRKEKIRINLNIVKPFLFTKSDIMECISHYDKMGFNEIKLSEIQHGKDCFVSFEKTFGIRLPSPFYGGCQTYINVSKLIPGVTTPVLLKRSCFMCEETLSASIMDGIKVAGRLIFGNAKNKYGVIYENGSLRNKWI